MHPRVDFLACGGYLYLEHGSFRLNRFGGEVAKGFFIVCRRAHHQCASQSSGAPIPVRFNPR